MKLFLCMFAISSILLGCASEPARVDLVDPEQDAMLKAFAVAPDQAGLFIYRTQRDSPEVWTSVRLDGTLLGNTSVLTYLYTPVAPGNHVITSSAENTDTLELDIKAGTLAYVWQEVEIGPDSPQVTFHRMREQDGRVGVLECKLAASRARTQVIEVQVQADDPAWGGPLECRASNSFGIWNFSAPGTVIVQSAVSPLQITCDVPAGSEMEASATSPGGREKVQEGAREGASTGAKMGAGAGVALGVAAAPVMGPVVAVMLAVGTTFKGAELGGMVGALSTGGPTVDDQLFYPSPIAVHIRRLSETN
jgi:hypothetical protein